MAGGVELKCDVSPKKRNTKSKETIVTQTQKLFLRGILATTILSAAVVLGIARTRPVAWLEAGTYDARMRWTARPSQSDSSVVIIAARGVRSSCEMSAAACFSRANAR